MRVAKLAAELAGRTHGFVGADLALMCKQALIVALRRRWQKQQELESTAENPAGTDTADADADLWLRSRLAPSALAARGSLRVMPADLKAAARSIAPSALRDLVVEVPKTRWRDVGGQDEVKQALREARMRCTAGMSCRFDNERSGRTPTGRRMASAASRRFFSLRRAACPWRPALWSARHVAAKLSLD